jgi:hypothetical protein
LAENQPKTGKDLLAPSINQVMSSINFFPGPSPVVKDRLMRYHTRKILNKKMMRSAKVFCTPEVVFLNKESLEISKELSHCTWIEELFVV